MKKRQKSKAGIPVGVPMSSSTPRLSCLARNAIGEFNAPGRSRGRLMLLAGFLGGISLIGTVQAELLPDGPRVRSGQISFLEDSLAILAITQMSATAAIDWSSFSIGEHGHVLISQPTAHALLVNRVVGDASSVLAGNMTATGIVALINPNGIVITPTGNIVATGFLASTLPLNDVAIQEVLTPGNSADLHGDIRGLLHGPRTHTVNSTAQGLARATVDTLGIGRNGSRPLTLTGISHGGAIRVSEGGTVMLVSESVSASGLIAAQGGRIAIVAADQPVQAPHMPAPAPAPAPSSLSLSASAFAAGPDLANGHDLRRDVTLGSPAVQVRGVIQTGCYSGRRGQVLIAADGKSIDIRGELDAISVAGQGGSITLVAADITMHDALFSVVGSGGGGQIIINTGAAPPNKAHVDVRGVTMLMADATRWGTGGDISISTLGDVRFDATAHAKGARDAESDPSGRAMPVGVDGAEAVGKGGTILFHAGTHLAVRGDIDASHTDGASSGQVELRARSLPVADWDARGDTSLLPSRAASSLVTRRDANGNDVHAISAGSLVGGVSNISNGARVHSESVIDASTLSRILQTSNVVLSTDINGSTAARSDIAVRSRVAWTSDHALITYSARDIGIHAPISATGQYASVHFMTGSSGRLTFSDGAITLPGAGSRMSVNGLFYGMIRSPHDITAALSQGDNGHYALAMPINMASLNFQPITTPPGKYFSHFEGMGNTISNLHINAPTTQNVGLFSTLGDAARVSNIVFVNASVIGAENVGVLSGTMEGRSVAGGLTFVNVSAALGPASSVSAWVDRLASGSAVGGVTGSMHGESFVYGINGLVDVRGDENVGGITGTMASTLGIGFTSLQGSVVGTRNVGGVVGQMSGSGLVQSSVWRGAVRGTAALNHGIGACGGLVGYQKAGTIARSHAFGTVAGLTNVGGLVGMAAGNALLENCHACTQVEGQLYAGSAVGIVADDARLSLIHLEGADRRLGAIGARVSVSELGVSGDDSQNGAPGYANLRSGIPARVLSAEVDAQYIPSLLSPATSPLASEAPHDREAAPASGALLVWPPTSPPTSPLIWQPASPIARAAVSGSAAQPLPILASAPVSPRMEEAMVDGIEEAMVTVTLPAALEMPARMPYDMVDVEPMIMDFRDLEDPPAPRYEWPTGPF